MDDASWTGHEPYIHTNHNTASSWLLNGMAWTCLNSLYELGLISVLKSLKLSHHVSHFKELRYECHSVLAAEALAASGRRGRGWLPSKLMWQCIKGWFQEMRNTPERKQNYNTGCRRQNCNRWECYKTTEAEAACIQEKKMRQGRSSINVYILGRNRMRKNQMSSKLENVDSRYPRRNCFPRTWNSRHQHHQQLWESLSEPLAQFKRSIFPLGLSHRLSQFVSTSLIRSSQVNRQAGGKFVNLSHWIPFIWWFWAQTHDA